MCARWQVDLHGMHVEEALTVLDRHLVNLGGLGSPSGILLQVTHARTHAHSLTHRCTAWLRASGFRPRMELELPPHPPLWS